MAVQSWACELKAGTAAARRAVHPTQLGRCSPGLEPPAHPHGGLLPRPQPNPPSVPATAVRNLTYLCGPRCGSMRCMQVWACSITNPSGSELNLGAWLSWHT